MFSYWTFEDKIQDKLIVTIMIIWIPMKKQYLLSLFLFLFLFLFLLLLLFLIHIIKDGELGPIHKKCGGYICFRRKTRWIERRYRIIENHEEFLFIRIDNQWQIFMNYLKLKRQQQMMKSKKRKLHFFFFSSLYIIICFVCLFL